VTIKYPKCTVFPERTVVVSEREWQEAFAAALKMQREITRLAAQLAATTAAGEGLVQAIEDDDLAGYYPVPQKIFAALRGWEKVVGE
jgi:hypothetical protein